MDASTRAVKTHRKRLHARGMKRVEVTVPARDAKLVRQVAAALRAGGVPAQRITKSLRQITDLSKGPTVAEVIDAGPDISGPEFDAVFEEIERFRHDPVLQKVRDVDP